ncbi:unnamed protein product [Cylicocyclus nassatus]|uniref:SCP domain-containing protein n=1 Tax=Cylicocyclus nassatus TaxID=53992 RepID=A0AA36M921_CYLNA|nr:unnamed protein product [Cylicocyclus nassatus]
MFLFSILPLTAILVPSASSEAYCSDGQLEKSVIDSILDPINKIRSVLAQGNLKDGKAPPANIFPQANAMNKLEWDCNLEKTAIRKLDCDISTAPVVNNKAVLFYDDPDEFGLSPSCAVAAWLREHSAASFNGLTGAPTEIKRPNNDGKFENFANLMNDKTTKIGCAHICESGKRPLLCLTNKPPIPKDGTGVIYTVNATKACSGCNKNTRPCNTETRLCEAPEQSTTESTTEATTKTTTETAKATTKATTKTTTETAKATTTTTMKASYPGELPTGTNKDCPDNVGMTDELRTQYVNTQNDKRSSLAKGGQVKRPSGNILPSGANILKLSFKCELEKKAIEEVRECPTYKTSDNNSYGKNFGTSIVTSTYSDALDKAVTNWWNVVSTERNGPGMQVTFRSNHVNQPVESYTQIAWANTKYTGCAIAKCSSSYTVICLYEPKGNIVDQVLYMKGSPCAACPTTCDSALGLCVQ